MNNNFQNPLKVIKAKSQAAWSGCIEIEEPQDASVGWNVYLLEGKIQYVTSSIGQQERLNYLWQRCKLGSQCPRLDKQEATEYVQVCESLSSKNLSDIEIKKILFRFTREGFVNVLSIDRAKIKFIPAKRIKNPVISFSIEQLGAKLHEQIKGWIKTRTYLSSTFCRLHVDREKALSFYKFWKPQYDSPEMELIAKDHKLSSFVSLFVAKSSFYQIATKANVDTYFLAKCLQQCIAENLIDLYPFKELTPKELEKNASSQSNSITDKSEPESLVTSNSAGALIVCIDDSKTVQKQVKLTLEAGGYQVLGILDPTEALKELSHHQPAVIFLDINMPELNGYDLCSLLRKSHKFKDIPIVMLTGRDGMIDRVRAKIVGATDYLTKPCDPNKLITLARILEKSAITV